MNTDVEKSERILKSLCPAVSEVCQPLFNYLSVSFFRYIRSYPNGDKIILCTDANWLTEYFKDKLYDVEYANFHKIPKFSSGVSVHSKCIIEDPVCDFWNKMSNVTNYNLILALYEKYDSYLEFYNFCLIQDTHAANNIFLNNHSIFHHFIEYFRDKGQSILEQAEQAKFACKPSENYDQDTRNNWMLGLETSLERIVVDQMPVNRFYLNGSLDKIYLTRNEAVFVKHLINGENIDSIAKKLNLSMNECNNIEKQVMAKLNVNNEKDLRKVINTNRIAKKLTYL
jgi:hypothetical protein